MKERPILFSGPMVRAILEGQKTVTRRAVKDTGLYAIDAAIHGDEVAQRERAALATRCPFGQPGDRLWVREAWHVGKPHDNTAPADILPPLLAEGRGITVLYDAGGWKSFGPAGREEQIYPDNQPLPDWAGKGRPSIHMPRAFSRILLEITDVRIERLQDISLQQVRAEGCEVREFWLFGADAEQRQQIGARVFAHLWTDTGGDWDANPWVWVVEFKRVTP